MPSKKIFFVFAILIVVLAGLGALLGFTVANSTKQPVQSSESLSDYSAVYMMTGDVYFGKLSWTPTPKLTDAWIIQRPAAAGGQLAITPFKNVFWGPSNEIDLNANQIVFSTRLRNDSQMVPYFTNPSLLNNQAIPQQGTPFGSSPTPGGK